jgi:hypothetical protein
MPFLLARALVGVTGGVVVYRVVPVEYGVYVPTMCPPGGGKDAWHGVESEAAASARLRAWR